MNIVAQCVSERLAKQIGKKSRISAAVNGILGWLDYPDNARIEIVHSLRRIAQDDPQIRSFLEDMTKINFDDADSQDFAQLDWFA